MLLGGFVIVARLVSVLFAFLFSVAVYASTVSQKLGVLALDGRGQADVSIIVDTDATGRADARQIQVIGKLMGHTVNELYGESDLEDMRSTGHSRTLLHHLGMDVLTFLAMPDFSLQDGGTVKVGYVTSPTTRRSSLVEIRLDSATNQWFIGYREQPGAELTHVVRLDVTIKSIPIIGPVGLRKIVATDDLGRKFEVHQN